MRLRDLASVSGTVVLCGLGVEVDAFVRRAPAQMGATSWRRVAVVEQRRLGAERLEALAEVLGHHVVQEAAVPEDAAVVVRSPGFALAPDVRHRVPTTNPAALWLAERATDRASGRTIGVTGTKGKSSVVTLLAEELDRRGQPVFLGGNVGTALWERPPDDPCLAVAEISSYQAIELEHSPDVAAITLLGEDHLDLHRTLDGYHQAKLNVVCGAAHPAQVAVVPEVDRATVQARCGALPLRLVPHDEDVRRSNARVAAELLAAIGEVEVVDEQLVEGLVAAYPELPGRFQEVAGAGTSVQWVDDSLASNAAALVAALGRTEREHPGRALHLIAGGRDDRGVSTEPVVAAVQRCRPRSVLCIDEFGGRLADDLRAAGGDLEAITVDRCASLEDAVALAHERTEADSAASTVLFSPGAPTPVDQGSWKDRSRRFGEAAQGRSSG